MAVCDTVVLINKIPSEIDGKACHRSAGAYTLTFMFSGPEA